MIPGRGPAPMPLPRESALTARGQGSRGLEKEQLPGEMAVITASPQGTAPPQHTYSHAYECVCCMHSGPEVSCKAACRVGEVWV